MKYININLLGPDAQKPSALPIPAGLEFDPVLIGIVLLGSLVSFGLPNVLTWGVEKFLNEPAASTIDANTKKLQGLKSGSLQLVERQKELETLEADLRALQGLVGVGGRWASILEELRAITPTDLWLTGLKTEGDKLEMTGSALDYKAVAYFYTNFQNARNFAGPILGTVAEQAGIDGSRPVVQFTMRASIVTPGVGGE